MSLTTTSNTTITTPYISSNAKSSASAVYTVSVGGSGGSGGVYLSPNTNATTAVWANGWSNTTNNGNIQIKGNAEIEGGLKINGKDIIELFEKIEERLAILHPNTELESRWEELKELSKRYRELEAEIIEKEKIWAILKK